MEQSQPIGYSSSGGGEGVIASEALSQENLVRYEKQYQSIQRVCTQVSFDHPSASPFHHSQLCCFQLQYETDPKDFAKIMDLIQGMQAYGDPPSGAEEPPVRPLCPSLE